QYNQTAQALREGDLETAGLSTTERLLLEFVGTLTRHAHHITDEQVQGLRDAGWTDAQIAEAVYEAALLNFFNRIADAFDIRPPVAPDPIDPPRHQRWLLLGVDPTAGISGAGFASKPVFCHTGW
ncbi:MAG: carboxymuconolactone decarboxylase family protein, partial [Actinomycetota bacterium]|nr:carboxymuconolactone decarboxylase family protein [Actinomycetota bacterium]